ncbi:MAG: tripartite tricarboxylate transporter substrate binding protein [Pseudomonadota bacterium]
MIELKHLKFLLMAAAVCSATAVFAASIPGYPTRPIRLLLPFAPGGSADAIGRIISPKLSEAMGQQWVVDNRGGAAGNIAAETVARAAPDGHTVFLGLSTVVTANPALYKLSFSMEQDLQAVTMLTISQYILVLNPSVPADSVKELIALAKQKPRSLNYSSGGIGSPLHLAAELFQKRAGIEMVHVPYKSGGASAAAVLSGETQFGVSSIASSMQLVKAGRLKAIATTGLRRSQVAPDLPTLAESGFPGLEVSSWYGLLVPSGTFPSIVQRIRNEAIKAVQAPEVHQALAGQGLQVETSTPQEFAARIRSDTKTWAEIIKSAGIKAE